MDGQPSASQRGGGGRGDSSRRRGSGGRGTYRRVQTPKTDVMNTSSSKANQDDKSSYRSVLVVDDAANDAAPPAPYRSSLRSSLENAKTSKTSERKDFQTKERRIISLSSPSPQKKTTKKFVSSLLQSTAHAKNERESTSRLENDGQSGRKVTKYKLRHSNNQEPPRALNQRKDVQLPHSRDHPRRSNSREPRQWPGDELKSNHFKNQSGTNNRLHRKSSTDSGSSLRSDRSDTSFRSERYNDERWISLNERPQLLQKHPANPVPLNSSLKDSLKSNTREDRSQKGRPASESIGRSYNQLSQDSSRRLSLDGVDALIRKSSSNLANIESGTGIRAHLAGSSGNEGRSVNASAIHSSAPKSENNATQGIAGIIAKTPTFTEIDDIERRRRAGIFKERMEARIMARGGSVAQMMKVPIDSLENEVRHHSPIGAKNKLKIETVKDARTRDFFSKRENEDAERETARRAVPFKSSLREHVSGKSQTASINSTPQAILKPASNDTRQMQTLSAKLTSSQKSVSRARKLQYSVTELRRLMIFAAPKPPDLINMKIVEVIQVRDAIFAAKRSTGKLKVGIGIRKSIGSTLRRGDRSSGRGVDTRDARRDKQGGRGISRGGRGSGGRGGYGRTPPPPLYDGPIEPLKISENRWKPTKGMETSSLEKTLSHVKSMLNKLTREKFVKLTNELCAISIDNYVLLSSIVSIIMDKALEEPSFADVYADLCKEFYIRTIKQTWNFLSVLNDEKGSFYWTGIDKAKFAEYVGPFDSPRSCFDDADASESTATEICEFQYISGVHYRRQGDCLIGVGEKAIGAYFYSKRKINEIGDDEPFGGPFLSAELARLEAAKQTTFKRLLIIRCQSEFEKTNKHAGFIKAKEEEENDPRRREIRAMRAKAKMLGNIRFIGELYKVDLIKQAVVQECIFYLLGLDLMTGEDGQEAHAQAVRFPDEQDLEALCKMLATVGKKFDQPNTKTIMKIIILRMVELSNDTKLPSRARFLMKDILETRDHMWEPRRKEMQQKTLEEVRKEAYKLQQQGKNAQHDDVQRRRQKARISSAQLAKQSTNLIVAKKEEPEHDETLEKTPAQMSIRIKSTIEEYLSILDLDEVITCIQELPGKPYNVEFAEQILNRALEGKADEREHAVELLVRLYERGTLDANSIQTALVNVMEFLVDMKIDLPLIHQYSALIFGRLVSAGCFGLSWIFSHALSNCIECELTSMVFAEVLSVLEMETDERTVIRMLTNEEITPESVLPTAMKNKIGVEEYVRKHGIDNYFIDSEDDLDEDFAEKMRSTLEEYLSINDYDELVRCIEELTAVPDRWRHFVHIMLIFSLEVKQSVRRIVSELLLQLFTAGNISADDITAGLEIILDDFNDLHVDIPQLAVNLSDLWTPLFAKKVLSIQWLSEACSHLIENGVATDVFDALLSAYESQNGLEALVSWWKWQANTKAIWKQLSPSEPKDKRVTKWELVLQ
ncbi:hypothetical protein CCR75_004112 [Bremia lactucae]|uniref:MI domain-containing protein n=1 Tax=Bremia lactucae TaxID=4779 RepID=A0A976FKI1_BRELC|nr:hypothetical protein CCR75_004112 [Bremia lactucae]